MALGVRVGLLIGAAVLCGSAADAGDVVRRIAGTGTPGFSGDGGPARDARFGRWLSVAVDRAGNVVVADTLNHRIRRIDATGGHVVTIAGNGVAGFAGDGGAAVAARLASPRGVAVDAHGNVFVADTDNGRIRRVTPAGRIDTVAGSGQTAPPGARPLLDGWFATKTHIERPIALASNGGDRMIWFGGGLSGQVWRVDVRSGFLWTAAGTGTLAPSGDGGPATRAGLGAWISLAVDPAGNLFIADRDAHRVRRVDAATGTIATVVGTGSAGFAGDGGPAAAAQLSGPTGLAVDATGNLYIADRDNHRVRRVDARTGTIATIAGDGTADCGGREGPARATPVCPTRLAVDDAGRVVFVDVRDVPVVMRLEPAP